MSGENPYATLRELELRVQHIDALLEARLANIEIKFRELDRALNLQAKEYERRLHELNNSAAREAAALRDSLQREASKSHEFVKQEIFDRFEKQYNSDKNEIARALSLREGQRAGTDTTRNYMIAFVGLLATVVFVILAVIRL